jgi:hypothetical protein
MYASCKQDNPSGGPTRAPRNQEADRVLRRKWLTLLRGFEKWRLARSAS